MLELDIESLAYGGDAVGRLADGRTAFVTGACPGDRVAAVIDEERERFVRAHVSEVLSPSPDRVSAPCPYFGRCGGCTWQHVSYRLQCDSKRRAVVDALERIGHIPDADSIVGPIVASKYEYGYRNKVEFVVDPASARPRLGFHVAKSETVVPVESCMLLPKKHQKAPRALGGALRYLAGDSDLGLVRVGYRVAVNTQDVEVALWTSPGAFPRNAVAKTLRQAVPASSIVRVLTKGPSRERTVSGVEALAGRGNWRERLGDIDYAISAPSFFQVNSRAAARMIEIVREALQPDGSDRALDLYAGAGTFTMPLAQLAGDVVAVEAAGPAVRDLRRNLESNHLWAEVVGGDAAREIATLGHFDIAVVDPPRSGLSAEVIASLASTRPRDVAYVSCDPATLARDCRMLVSAGYELVSATPVDLFPQSYHVETVAHFRPTHG